MSEEQTIFGYSRETFRGPVSIAKKLAADGVVEWCHLCCEYHPVQDEHGLVANNWDRVKQALGVSK